MSCSIIAAIADFMFVCVVCICGCMLQVCPALSLRPLPAFMFCFVCVWASVHAVGWEMSRSIIAAVADFMFVCVVCVWAYRLQVCPALSLRPMPALCYVLFVFLCVCLSLRVCSWGWEMSCSIIAAIADFMLCFVCVSLCVFGPAHMQSGPVPAEDVMPQKRRCTCSLVLLCPQFLKIFENLPRKCTC